MSRKAVWFVAACAVTLLFLPERGQACSCIGPIVTCNRFWETEYVFDGTVRGIERITRPEDVGGRLIESDEYLVSLDVHRTWKGVEGARLEVLTHTQGSACGFEFQIGRRYLVFASRRGTDGRIGVNTCSPTKDFENAAGDIAWLESLRYPSNGGRVYGEAVLDDQDLSAAGESQEGPLEGIRITLDGPAGRRETRTGSDGRYEFLGLTEGEYRIAAHFAAELRQSNTARQVRIPDARACAQADFWTSSNGSIEGRVFQEDGSPAQRVAVQLAAAGTDLDGPSFRSVMSATDADGFYRFEDLPPGRYLVGVNLRNARRYRYPRTLHMTKGEPTVVELKRAEGKVLLPFRLPEAGR
jgi:hypothetical protein